MRTRVEPTPRLEAWHSKCEVRRAHTTAVDWFCLFILRGVKEMKRRLTFLDFPNTETLRNY